MVRAERARRSLYEFVKQAWSILEPAMPFRDGWHVRVLCEHLEAVSRGEIKRLLINVPPGHAKSLIVSVFWPAWIWANNPAWRGLFSAYASELAIRDSIKTRQVIESVWYQRNFARPIERPESEWWSLSGDQNVKGHFTNTRTGARLSLSVGSKATGFRGNATVCDDPLNLMDAASKLKRDEAIYWWDKSMSSRLNDMAHDVRVMIMQRLHEDDPAGFILRQLGYEHVCLPSEYEPKRRSITFVTKTLHASGCPGRGAAYTYESISPETGDVETLTAHQDCTCEKRREKFWEDPRTVEGELLFPELFPASVLAEAKKILAGSGYAGQHQQRPAPDDGNRFKKGWWRFWKHDGDPDVQARPEKCYPGPARVLPQMHRMSLSLDATFKDTDGTDYVVIQCWGANGADRYLMDQARGRWSFTETCAQLLRMAAKWPHARRRLVEDKANGSAVINALKSKLAGLIEVNPEGGKESRAAACQPEVESGNVYLPDGHSLLDEFITEWAVFPNGSNDDQVDAGTQCLNDFAGRSGGRTRGLANL